VLAEYFTTDKVTYLFGVRSDWGSPRIAEIRRPLAEIRGYVAEHFGRGGDGEAPRGLSSQVRQLDVAEWQQQLAPFVEPVLGWTEPGDYLYLVPHDVLHYLPYRSSKIAFAAPC
jgi:hypothetical protein